MLHTYSVLFLLVAVSCLATAEDKEKCFDKDTMQEKYNDAIVKCKTEHPLGSEKRTQKMIVCLLKEHQMLDDNLVLDIKKFKEEADSVALKFKDELSGAADECWDGSKKSRRQMIQFFLCYTGAVHKICPETAEWRKQILEE